jgi:nucleoside-diphosphate-sugar epimerase
MRVLLTGASGFIGSHVARLAVGEGHEVTALVRPGSSLHRLEDVRDELQLLEGDLHDAPALEKPLGAADFDACLHLAWYAEPGGKCLWAHENLDCLTGSLAFVRVLRAIDCPRLVIAGTSVEYDTSSGYVSETSAIRPANLYAAAKHALFLTASKVDVGGWSVATARIFSVYGPWEDRRRLVPFVISKLLAGAPCELTRGEQIRDYSHVEDAAAALWAIAKSPARGPVNVASSKPVSVASIAERIGDILGRRELLRFGARESPPDDPPFLVANTDRLRHDVGWTPRYDLDSGLADTVAWWRSHEGEPAR